MKRKRLYIFIVALLLIGIPLMSSAQINVSLPENYYGSAGDTVMIPVTTGDLTGEGVESYEFTLTFDSSVLEVIDFEAGPVSDGMTIVTNGEVDGEFSVAASHNTGFLSGSGQVGELEVAMKDAGVTDIVWSSFMFNEGTPDATTTDCNVGVDVVRVGLSDLTGQVPDSIVVPIMVSDMTGLDIESYEFTLIYNEDLMNVYDVDESGTLSEDMIVTSNDVDGQLNVAAALTGGVLEGSGTLLNLKVEFTGAGTDSIRFGDFLFNDGTPLDVTADTATVTVLPRFSILLNDLQFGEIGDTVDLTVSVDGDLTGSKIESYEFALDYPGSLMDFIEVNKTGTVSEDMTVTSNNTDGTLNIAAASTEYLVGSDQDLLHISFKVVDGGEGEAYFNSFNFNDGAVDANYDDTSKVSTGFIDVSLPDASGLVGDTILYPINVEDITGLGIEAYEFTLNFDNSAVDVIGYDKSSTLSEDFTVQLNDAIAGEVTVAASMGTVELTGEGVLLYLKMVLITEATIDFTWSYFIFNEGIPASETHSGTLDIITNIAPEFVNTLPDTTIYESQALSYTYTATDADVLAYSLVGATEGAAIDGSSGEFTWTPTYEQAGTYNIVAVVSDGALTDTSTAVVIVLDYVPGVDLFFSEYIEGSSYNKALEIYNGKDVAVNLAEYSIKGTHNGDADWEYAGFNFPDIELAAGDVYVICDVGAGPEITAIADTLLVYDPNKTMGFNGDDARALFWGEIMLDIIGFTDGDPGNGWDVAGVTDATKDHTLIRKATVTMGNVDFAISAGTDEATSEWVVMPQNTFGFLGAHPHTDFVGPEIAGVVAISETALQVRFSEEVDPVTAAAVANYSIDGGIGNPASVEMVKNNIAVLTIAAIEANAPYTVSVTGVKDLTDLALVDTTVGFKLVDPGELPIDITINDFETDIGNWAHPTYSGSTSGILTTSTFEVSDEFAYAGSKSGKMTLLDDSAVEGGWFVRLWNINRVDKLAADSKLFLYLRGADADIQIRLVIRDDGSGGDNGYEAGEWHDITVTEDDWQVVSLDLLNDPVTGWVNGNGVITSTNTVSIDCIQLQCSEDISTVLYFDMITERPIDVGIEDVSALPKEFALHQNYPNPFNPITTIKYELPKESLVKIIVFDLMGKEVRTLVSQKQNAGYQTVIWNATDNYGRKVSSGYYIYIMQAESFHKTQKMILLK